MKRTLKRELKVLEIVKREAKITIFYCEEEGFHFGFSWHSKKLRIARSRTQNLLSVKSRQSLKEIATFL